MDNALNIEKCKLCGGLVSIDKSEVALAKVCTCCGYFYSEEYHNNSFGSKSNRVGNMVEYLKPCGAYKFITFSGVGQVGTLGENITEEEVLRKFNFSDTSRLNMNKSYINYRDPETNMLKIIFGEGIPESYDEFVGKK